MLYRLHPVVGIFHIIQHPAQIAVVLIPLGGQAGIIHVYHRNLQFLGFQRLDHDIIGQKQRLPGGAVIHGANMMILPQNIRTECIQPVRAAEKADVHRVLFHAIKKLANLSIVVFRIKYQRCAAKNQQCTGADGQQSGP